MMVKNMVSAGIGAIVGAALLYVVSLAGAPSAKAQIDEEPDPADLACFIYEALIDVGELQCEELGCDPSEKDCKKFCNNARQGCDKAGKDTEKLFKNFGKTETKSAKTLCKTANDPKECKRAVKELDKAIKGFSKQFKKGSKAACKDEGIQSDCNLSCKTGAPFPACDG